MMRAKKEVIRFIEIDEELMKHLEILHFDITGYNSILRTIFENKDKEFDKELYNEFMKEYRECNRFYEFTKRQLIDQYVPEELNIPEYLFTFNFFKNGIEVEENTKKGCSC